jgi:hypothetical protein
MAAIDEDRERYFRAAHAMQSGVAADQAMGSDDGSPKHLRTGVNSALTNQAGLVNLLIAKGVFTEEEYVKAIADEMEAEVKRYEDRLSEGRGNIHLS